MEMEMQHEQDALCEIKRNMDMFKLGGPMRTIPFQVGGVATMHLDADNKIYYLQFEMVG